MTMQEYRNAIVARLSDYRATHSLNVAKAAVQLAEKYGADVEQAEIAGLLHDCTKEMPPKEQLQLLEEFDIIITSAERCAHKLLHAVTGPVIARTEFGITDEAVLSAIRYHTTGKAGMTLLEKIIYVADFISEERSFPGVEQLRVKAFENLDDAVFAGLAFTLQDLTARGKPVHPDTVAAYNEQAFVLAWARQHAKQEREDRT